MKLYLDTSVFGAYFDKEFKEDTIAFFDYAREQQIRLIYSDLTERELKNAPTRVKDFLHTLKQNKSGETIVEQIEANSEAMELAEHYMVQGALSRKCKEDALHIAMASLHQVDVLVSWNFRHMVNFVRIEMYNTINAKLGYSSIDIRSPKEIRL